MSDHDPDTMYDRVTFTAVIVGAICGYVALVWLIVDAVFS